MVRRRGSVVIGLALAVVAACGRGERAAPEAAGGADTVAVADTSLLPFQLTQAQAEGKAIFETMCWTCHGPSGHGDGPAVVAGSVPKPPDFTTGQYPRLSGSQIQARFSATQPGMDRHPTMQFVQSMLQPEVFAKALAYVPILGYPPEIPGSAIAGAATYGTRCVACHGRDGDGKGWAAGQLALAPADFTQDTLLQKRNFDALFRRVKEGGGTIHGSSMPPWGVLLPDRDIWDLVAFIASFQPVTISAPPSPGP